MSTHSNHPYHLVDYSPWPLTGALGAMITVSGLVKWFHQFNINLFMIGTIVTILTMIQWWRDVTREGTFQGLPDDHLKQTNLVKRLSMLFRFSWYLLLETYMVFINVCVVVLWWACAISGVWFHEVLV